jgi:hypothetical protein
MTGEQPRHGPGESPAGRPAVTGLTVPADQPAADEEGGETACWAHLVCAECGAMLGEDHRDGCRS